MRTLVICESVHHGNTQRVAAEMSRVLGAELARPGDVPAEGRRLETVGLGPETTASGLQPAASPLPDTVGPLKWIRGLNRGRPDGRDLKRARDFARRLKS